MFKAYPRRGARGHEHITGDFYSYHRNVYNLKNHSNMKTCEIFLEESLCNNTSISVCLHHDFLAGCNNFNTEIYWTNFFWDMWMNKFIKLIYQQVCKSNPRYCRESTSGNPCLHDIDIQIWYVTYFCINWKYNVLDIHVVKFVKSYLGHLGIVFEVSDVAHGSLFLHCYITKCHKYL